MHMLEEAGTLFTQHSFLDSADPDLKREGSWPVLVSFKSSSIFMSAQDAERCVGNRSVARTQERVFALQWKHWAVARGYCIREGRGICKYEEEEMALIPQSKRKNKEEGPCLHSRCSKISWSKPQHTFFEILHDSLISHLLPNSF